MFVTEICQAPEKPGARLTQYLWLLTKTSTLTLCGPGSGLCFSCPSFSFFTNLPFQPCTLLDLGASLGLLALSLLIPSLFFSHSSPCPCSVWTLPETSGCALPHVYNKTFPQHFPGSVHVLIFIQDLSNIKSFISSGVYPAFNSQPDAFTDRHPLGEG